MHIHRQWSLDEPVRVSNLKGRNLCCFLDAAWGLELRRVAGGMSVADVLQSGLEPFQLATEVPLIVMPPEVAALAARGRWSHLLGLYRWIPLRRFLPAELLQQRVAPSHAPPVNVQSIKFGEAEVRALASDLRRYADGVIAHNGEEEPTSKL